MFRFWNIYKTSEVEMDFNIRRYRLPLLLLLIRPGCPPHPCLTIPQTCINLLAHPEDEEADDLRLPANMATSFPDKRSTSL